MQVTDESCKRVIRYVVLTSRRDFLHIYPEDEGYRFLQIKRRYLQKDGTQL